MKLTLKNIGKIGTASVEINGITVIAGENNTGKSTVGRALFAVFNSFCNIQKQIENERVNSVENCLIRMYTNGSLGLVNTNEIAEHDRSFLKPWIFLKRLFLLWEILYELDTHRYHVHKTFMERFGIYRELETIRAEYNSLLTHAMSYFSVIIAISAAILTVLQLWK